MNPPNPAPETYDRRKTLVEDAVNLSCLAALFVLLMAKPRIPDSVAQPLMIVLLVVAGALFVRRKRRVDLLFRRMREAQQAEGQGLPGLPFVPGAQARMAEPPSNGSKPPKLRR